MDDITTPDPLATASSPASQISTRLSISLLSLPQASIAATLAQPGHEAHSIFTSEAFTAPEPKDDAVATSVAEVPAANDCIGTLQCEVISSTLLRDMLPTTPLAEDEISFDEEVEGGGLKQIPENYTMASNETPESESPSEAPDASAQGSDKVHGSELFICRVLSVSPGTGPNASNPLLYWRHKYMTVGTTE